MQRAIIEWECQQHLNRVTSLTDQQNWEALAQCYTVDGVLARPSDPANPVVGREAILASFRSRPPRTTAHLLGNSVFEIVSDSQVQAVSRVWLISGPQGTDTLPVVSDSQILIGTFVDQLSYIDGQWFTARREGSIEVKYA